MKIKDKEKFIALVEIALSEDKRISKLVQIESLARLVDGKAVADAMNKLDGFCDE